MRALLTLLAIVPLLVAGRGEMTRAAPAASPPAASPPAANAVEASPAVSPAPAAAVDGKPDAGKKAPENAEQLMVDGLRANYEGRSDFAEERFHAALSLLRKQPAPDKAQLALATMSLAGQLSISRQYAEADVQFENAKELVGSLPDRTLKERTDKASLRARLLHYRGVHLVNQYTSPTGNAAVDAATQARAREAEAVLASAQAAYTDLIPEELRDRPVLPKLPHNRLDVNTNARVAIQAKSAPPQASPDDQALLLSLIEVLRVRAGALADLGDPAGGSALLAQAQDLAAANNLDRASVKGRLLRTTGLIAERLDRLERERTAFRQSHFAFQDAIPNTKPAAEAALRDAKTLIDHGNTILARQACDEAVKSLISLQAGVSPELIAPCLDLYSRGGFFRPKSEDRAEMFRAAQVAQGTITSRQIAQASAALRASEGNSPLGRLLGEQDDLQLELTRIQHIIDQISTQASSGEQAGKIAGLQQQADENRTKLDEVKVKVRKEAPNLDQLVQQVVSANDVFSQLRPNEAFISLFLSDSGGWTFVLRNGDITAVKIPQGTKEIAGLVGAVRRGIEKTEPHALPAFDAESTRRLYEVLLGGVADKIESATALVIAPTGPLLSLPFGVLLTGPADPAKLADAPWLIRKAAIAHIPSPANFVSLRGVAATAQASKNWFGFGNATRVSQAQAERGLLTQVQKESAAAKFGQYSLLTAGCATSAAELANLPDLPGATKELEAARQIEGATANDELLRERFTPAGVTAIAKSLINYKVLHFSAHAVLPSELTCLTEPAIVTSAPSDAADQDGPLLTASRLQGLKLNANLVILSACNSGGPGGGVAGGERLAGESLSGLARSFFYARARSVLVTHWDADDNVAPFIVGQVIGDLRQKPELGVTGALQDAQVAYLRKVSRGELAADFAHPYLWAPFAVIGDGGGGAVRGIVSASKQ